MISVRAIKANERGEPTNMTIEHYDLFARHKQPHFVAGRLADNLDWRESNLVLPADDFAAIISNDGIA